MSETDRCKFCKNSDYDPLEYLVREEEFLNLDKERYLGISGHLRVKNEALSIAECIDSCIDFLDELIITYNDSEDNSEEILKQYAQKYKDRIRLYHYKPYVFPFTYADTIKNDLKINNFRDNDCLYDDIHTGANYYNYGYTKI